MFARFLINASVGALLLAGCGGKGIQVGIPQNDGNESLDLTNGRDIETSPIITKFGDKDFPEGKYALFALSLDIGLPSFWQAREFRHKSDSDDFISMNVGKDAELVRFLVFKELKRDSFSFMGAAILYPHSQDHTIRLRRPLNLKLTFPKGIALPGNSWVEILCQNEPENSCASSLNQLIRPNFFVDGLEDKIEASIFASIEKDNKYRISLFSDANPLRPLYSANFLPTKDDKHTSDYSIQMNEEKIPREDTVAITLVTPFAESLRKSGGIITYYVKSGAANAPSNEKTMRWDTVIGRSEGAYSFGAKMGQVLSIKTDFISEGCSASTEPKAITVGKNQMEVSLVLQTSTTDCIGSGAIPTISEEELLQPSRDDFR